MSDYESLLIVLSGLQQCFGNEDLLSGVVHVTLDEQDILCGRCVDDPCYYALYSPL